MIEKKVENILTCNVTESGQFDCNLNGAKIEINAIHMHNDIILPFTAKAYGYKMERGKLEAEKKYQEKQIKDANREADWARRRKEKQAEREARFGKR